MMNAVAPVLAEVNHSFLIRRFDTADLTTHGDWLLPRFMKTFPHLNERQAATFLQTVNYNNEFHFLYQDDCIALAHVTSSNVLSAKPIIWEKFVWCKDPEDKDQQKHAAEFYVHFQRWAKQQGVDVIVVEENTDVPHDLIKEKLGRIFTLQQQFARI